jgi:streptogramin lyase
VAFDGTNIWTANQTTSNVTRINPTTGGGTNVVLPAGATVPHWIAFDGTNMWTANFSSANVSKLVL